MSVYYVPGTTVSAFLIFSQLTLKTTLGNIYYYNPHFTAEKIGSGQGTCPRSHNQYSVGPGFKPIGFGFTVLALKYFTTTTTWSNRKRRH